jgi:cytochrome c oxidase accessory protein FixG
MQELYQYDQEYRDSLATVDAQGNRVWVYPKKPRGRLHNLRIVVTLILLGVLFAGPFITVRGQPFFLFNFFQRKFIIFGQVFWPQDFILFGLAMITFFVFVILFTTAFGRIWCGWACPQTLFMEMVFRKIEYLIEGDANQQRKLDAAPWNTEKIIKKGLKQLVFLIISLVIAHLLMAYLIGVDQVIELVLAGPGAEIAGFTALLVFTGIFYGVFAYFREQACTVVCPYGRLQGVLLNKESIVVAYDWLRGEPKGKLQKGKVAETHGDCIDCKLCVHACPTGIDIRNGTQLECVNCTACIDACDQVMDKISRPRGLIRYDSYNGIEEGKNLKFTWRLAGYTAVLVVLISALSYLLISRSDVETTVLRVPGQLYQETPEGNISNLYNIQVINKTFEDISLKINIINQPDASISKVGDAALMVPSNGMVKGVYFVEIPKDQILNTKTSITIGVYRDQELLEKVSTNFLGPVNNRK